MPTVATPSFSASPLTKGFTTTHFTGCDDRQFESHDTEYFLQPGKRARQRRWTKRQRHTIFQLMFQHFRQMIGITTHGHHPRPATLWRLTVESWLRCPGLILIRQNQNVPATFLKIWSHN